MESHIIHTYRKMILSTGATPHMALCTLLHEVQSYEYLDIHFQASSKNFVNKCGKIVIT